MAGVARNVYNRPMVTGRANTATQNVTPATYAPGQNLVIWKFNETDTTQIGTRAVPCVANSSPISSETLTVEETTTQVGKRLRFQLTYSTSSVTTNASLWPLLDDSGAVFQLPDRFIVRMRYRTQTLTNVSLLYFGFGVWNNNSSTPYGIGLAQSSNGTNNGVIRLQSSDAGTLHPWAVMNSTGAGATWISSTNIDAPGAFYQIKFDLKQGSGGNPFMGNAVYEMVAGEGASTQSTFTTIPAARSSAGSAFQTVTTTIDSGYNDQVCNYPMFFMIASTGTGTKTADFSVSDMEILVDPMDLH